jgi:alkylated DNA nucleotide flippase Atl1
VARLAGKPRAARAVGNIMRNCRAHDVPCHRVIAAGGRVGGYSDLTVKRALLRAEGVIVSATRVKDFARRRWPDADRRRQRRGRRQRRYNGEMG